MTLALVQARRASGRVWPNPAVGAVVWRGDRVLGRGRTRPPGGPHAEIVALDAARRSHGAASLRGASLAVTLEPCSFQGRTGPCARAVAEAGVRRVWIGHRDPHPRVKGRGVASLRRAGVEVEEGVLEAECRHQHRGFTSTLLRGRPWVELKLAASLDGRIATASGESRWITGTESRALVHRLRDAADAVMIGSGTARADDPSLTVRRGDRTVRAPLRVLVDSRLRVPATRALFRDEHAACTWVLTRPKPPERARTARERDGARLLTTPARQGHLDLTSALRRLGREGVGQVLVEGGGGLAAALLRHGLVDELHWFMAPRLLGSDARPAIADLGLAGLAGAPAARIQKVRRLGDDLYLHAMLESA